MYNHGLLISKLVFESTIHHAVEFINDDSLSGRITPESEKSPIFELIVPERVQRFGRYCIFLIVPPSNNTSPTTSLCATPERLQGRIRPVRGCQQYNFTPDISTQPAPER